MKHNKLERLIYLFSKLPGLGSRTGKRIVLHLIKHKERLMAPIAEALLDASANINLCEVCNNIDEGKVCHICIDPARDKTTLCIVESIADVWAIESARFYKGVYHVLGGTLSSSTSAEQLNIPKLFARISQGQITEIIIATNATIEGQTTAFFLTEKLKAFQVRVTRFANGIPIGGELDYLDEVTLSTAFQGRQSF
jgi:recombination protein RecR